MTRNIFKELFYQALTVIILLADVSFGQETRDLVNGNLIQFSENGAWCWYQDERGVIDTNSNMMIMGYVSSSSGLGGSPTDGDIFANIFDLSTRLFKKTNIKNGGGNAFYCDDHNAPAFFIRPDGKYQTIYAAHFNDTSSYYRIYDGSEWRPEQKFNWNKERPGGSNFQTTYSNVYYLADEGRVYNFVRGNNKSPNSMISTDMGDTWTYGGQLAYGSNIGYNNGYYRYNGNGKDRIDFICTEYHPRDYNTSIFHGYIKDGKSYKSDGTLVDVNILDVESLPNASDFTSVFAAGTVINGMTINRCWNTDVQRYEDGNVATIITGRINNNTGGSDNFINPEHCFIYCRYDGVKWSYTYLGQAGPKLYSSEADYTGLAAMHPNDPNVIFISTSLDPRNDKDLKVREIFKGTTNDNGAAWEWTQITSNSIRDNFRPIVPFWNNTNNALLWLRGTYYTAQRFDAAIVGIIENKKEKISKMNYADASAANTTFADGSVLVTTGPDVNSGAGDNKWHERTGIGNGGSVFTSSEVSGENAPALKTKISFSKEGTYDLWVNFWANTTADWRIKAGLSQNNMQVFRQMACKQVDADSHQESIELLGSNNTFLYQAYLGRVEKKAGDVLDVFVDDESATGNNNTLTGNTSRTWYDGIGYAKVDENIPVGVAQESQIPARFSLSQNYPNPFNPSTVIGYRLSQNGFVTLKVYDVLGREIVTLVNEYKQAGNYNLTFDTTQIELTSGVYFYTLKAGNDYLQTKKMILMR